MVNVDAEVAVLGSVMVDPSLWPEVAGIVREEHFENSFHRRVFAAIRELHRHRAPVDAVTVADKLGGPDVMDLVRIAQSYPSAVHAAHYARIVVESYHRRRVGIAATALSYAPDDPDRLHALRNAVREMEAVASRVQPMRDVLTGYLAELDERAAGRDRVIRTMIPGLDRVAGGFWRGGFVAIGGRPNAGKTSFLCRIAANMARQGLRTLYVSGESTPTDLMDILASQEAGLSAKKLTYRADAEIVSKAAAAVSKYHDWPLWFVDSGRLSLELVESSAEACDAQVVLVDYINRFAVPASAAGSSNRAAFFSDVAHGLKSLAIGRDITVVAAAQFNRQPEGRAGKEPTLADFKESGGVEEAARMALLLHPKLSEASDRDPMLPVDVIVAKNKGPMGTVPMLLDRVTLRYIDREDDPL